MALMPRKLEKNFPAIMTDAGESECESLLFMNFGPNYA